MGPVGKAKSTVNPPPRGGEPQVPPVPLKQSPKTAPTSWANFLSSDLTKAILEISKNYHHGDFEVFWNGLEPLKRESLDQEGIKEKFLKARVLFEVLRIYGLWGYQYELPDPQFLKLPPLLLQRIGQEVQKTDGKTRNPLFVGDCDDIAFLYAEIASYIGLPGTHVRMVLRNHVNVFVPLAPELELRLDPSEISKSGKYPPWNLPTSDYRPRPDEGEALKYEKGMNKHNDPYLKKQSAFRKRLSHSSLSARARKNLLARIWDPVPGEIVLSEKWMPVFKGFRKAFSCYREKLLPVVSKRVVFQEDRQAKLDMVSCVSENNESDLEKFGAFLGYWNLGQCVFLPTPEYGELSPLSCMVMMMGPFFSKGHSMKNDYHDPGAFDSPWQELRELQISIARLNGMDPDTLRFPDRRSANIIDWLKWIDEDLSESRPYLMTLLGALVHMTYYHVDVDEKGVRTGGVLSDQGVRTRLIIPFEK